MLAVDTVDSGYGTMQVLWNVSIQVEGGKITALLGPNGAGKSTTLRTIMGILKPWGGHIKFDNVDITNAPPHTKVETGITAVLEGRHLFGGMTVSENLTLGAYTKKAKNHLSDSLELVYSIFAILKNRRNQKAVTLSGGEQQMLTIARALMTKPKLIMLDEPSQGLAPKLTAEIFAAIEKLKQQGLTVLLVEQNAFDALELADRAYVISGGKVILEGDAGRVKDSKELRQIYLGI